MTRLDLITVKREHYYCRVAGTSNFRGWTRAWLVDSTWEKKGDRRLCLRHFLHCTDSAVNKIFNKETWFDIKPSNKCMVYQKWKLRLTLMRGVWESWGVSSSLEELSSLRTKRRWRQNKKHSLKASLNKKILNRDKGFTFFTLPFQ